MIIRKASRWKTPGFQRGDWSKKGLKSRKKTFRRISPRLRADGPVVVKATEKHKTCSGEAWGLRTGEHVA